MNDALWLDKPEEHDYPAAVDYLTLVMPPMQAETYAAHLREAKDIKRKAKDIMRASGLALLDVDNHHVKHNLKKIKDGVKLSPILLVVIDGVLVIADGYHRVCAAYHHDEDTEIPCRIVYKD